MFKTIRKVIIMYYLINLGIYVGSYVIKEVEKSRIIKKARKIEKLKKYKDQKTVIYATFED